MTEQAALVIGCGETGTALARRLAQERAFSRVIVADILGDRAEAAAQFCGSKATAVQLDCTDDDALGRLLPDVGLALNTVRLPTGRLLGLIRNAVEAGASYADCNRDIESLQAVFDSEYLEALAWDRAVSVIPGLGASPGLTNALTSYLGQRLDRVEEARFFLVDDLRRRKFNQWRDRLAVFGASALVWRDGDWQHVSPVSEWEDVRFPAPWGTVSCATVGLGPVSLPARITSLARVSSHRGFSDGDMEEIVRNLVNYGLGSEYAIDTTLGQLSPADFAAALYSGAPRYFGVEIPPLPLRFEGEAGPVMRQAQVSGVLKGRPTRFTMTYQFPGEEDADNEAATLAIGARMLLARELPAPGVHAPESLDPAPFLWDMERRGVEIQLTKTVEE